MVHRSTSRCEVRPPSAVSEQVTHEELLHPLALVQLIECYGSRLKTKVFGLSLDATRLHARIKGVFVSIIAAPVFRLCLSDVPKATVRAG